jgi:hypothetical protein
MIYRLISASNVIANVQDSFNINDSDWIGRAANWINHCLSDLGVKSELKVLSKTIKAIDYRIELPCEIKSLEAVEINNIRVVSSNQIANTNIEDNRYPYNEITYVVQGDNYIQLETENEVYKDIDVVIHYKSFPLELFKPFGIYLPYVPDIDIVQEAIATYIMIKILTRGYSHNVFNLNSQSPATNPYLAYYGLPGMVGLRKKARLAIKRMDKDAYEQASASIRSLNHPNRYFTKDFNNKL